MSEIGITAFITACLVLAFFRPFDGNPEPPWVDWVRGAAVCTLIVAAVVLAFELGA